MKIDPPKRPLQFLRWFCREDYVDEIEGDLTEIFRKEYQNNPRLATWRFSWNVVKYVRPEFIKAFKKSPFQPDSRDMYKNYFKVAMRNLVRHRTFTVINVAGLTLGIACALFIFLIVNQELSYDRYHAKADRVYRVNKGEPGDVDTGSPFGLAPILRTDFPEIEEAGIIWKLNPEHSNIEINKELFRESNTFIADPALFRLLDFKWLQGSPESLAGYRQAIITQSIAEKYFQGDAVGKFLKLNNGTDFTIAGIIADPPANTDFPARIIISYATVEKDSEITYALDGGTNSYFQTFILLRAGIDPLTIDPKLKKMVERYIPKERQKFHNFSIQPLSDIHFNVGNFNQRTISKETINTLRLIGVVILVVACINFINLASAQAIRRAKEVGVRKTLGSSYNSLVLQFLCETFLVTFASLVLAFLITSQLISFSASLFSIPLEADVLLNTELLLFAGCALVAVTLLSGLYPAFSLARYKPALALKGAGGKSGAKGLMVRKGLITLQFLVSQVLIICTIVAIQQTNFFLTKPLGFNKEAVVTFDLPESDSVKLSSLRNNLLTHPAITNVSFSLNTPSATINKWWANITHASFPGEERSAEVKFIDSTYLQMFEIERVAGSTRLPDNKADKIIVNEDFVRAIGMSDPEKAIGEPITYWGKPATIIGVVKDFQTVTLRQGMHPVMLTNNGSYAKGSVKIDMEHAAEALAAIDKHWRETFAGNYFEFAFLGDQLATFYKDEKKISRLLITFASVAISIGCIGLFGLIAFVTAQRAKEISVRKILGASTAHLATILSSDFMRLVLVAGFMAWPIAYYLLNSWLQGFENRISLLRNPGAFGVSLLLTVAFALITVSFQTIKAAVTNPVESIRRD